MKLKWRNHEIDIRQVEWADGELTGIVNGERVSVSAVETPTAVLVLGGDTPGTVDVAVTDHHVHVQWRGRTWTLERPVADDAGVTNGTGDGTVTAPMPGKVLACEVSAGETVAVDQVLVRMESMKLQVEVRAPSAGTVAAIHVSEGQMVEGGAVLVELATETT